MNISTKYYENNPEYKALVNNAINEPFSQRIRLSNQGLFSYRVVKALSPILPKTLSDALINYITLSEKKRRITSIYSETMKSLASMSIAVVTPEKLKESVEKAVVDFDRLACNMESDFEITHIELLEQPIFIPFIGVLGALAVQNRGVEATQLLESTPKYMKDHYRITYDLHDDSNDEKEVIDQNSVRYNTQLAFTTKELPYPRDWALEQLHTI